MKRTLAVVFMACFLAATPYQVGAHVGGPERRGCHRDIATGEPHCHRSSKDSRDAFIGALVVMGAILGLGLVVLLLRRDAPVFGPSHTTGLSLVPTAGFDGQQGLHGGAALEWKW